MEDGSDNVETMDETEDWQHLEVEEGRASYAQVTSKAHRVS